MDDIDYKPGVASEYFDLFQNSEGYFIKNSLPIVTYDEVNKRILLKSRY